jgi:hypothetical protein
MAGHDHDHDPHDGNDGAHAALLRHTDSDELKLLASPIVPAPRAQPQPIAATAVVSAAAAAPAGTRVDSVEAEQHDLEALGFRYKQDHDCPEFIKHSTSTTYELFYDLWFVANLEVFSEVHEITDIPKLTGYIGYVT